MLVGGEVLVVQGVVECLEDGLYVRRALESRSCQQGCLLPLPPARLDEIGVQCTILIAVLEVERSNLMASRTFMNKKAL